MGSFSSATGAVTLGMMLLGQRIFKVCMHAHVHAPRMCHSFHLLTHYLTHQLTTLLTCLTHSLQIWGWGVAALVTPTLLFATGATFFGLTLFSTQVKPGQ